jgi:predicted amidophosphoribosyltransferase
MVFKPKTEETDEGGIISLGEYRPWSFHKECGGNGSDWPEHSARTLDLKKKKAAGYDYFFKYLRKAVKSSTAVAVVPSSDSGKGPTTGVHSLATRLAKELGLSNGGACLVRHKTIAKKAAGGDRSIGVDLGSIRVEKADLIKGKVVLLLDDVTTSGNSLLACKRLLLKAGAKEVKMVALSRTTH